MRVISPMEAMAVIEREVGSFPRGYPTYRFDFAEQSDSFYSWARNEIVYSRRVHEILTRGFSALQSSALQGGELFASKSVFHEPLHALRPALNVAVPVLFHEGIIDAVARRLTARQVHPPSAVTRDEAHTALGGYTVAVENIEMIAMLRHPGDRATALHWLLNLPTRVSEPPLHAELITDLQPFITEVASPFVPMLLQMPLILNRRLKAIGMAYMPGELLYDAGFQANS